MANRYFNNIIDLFSGSKAKAADIEAHFTLITTGLDTVQTEMDAKAPTLSPALTGVPVAPTAAPGANTTQLATTAFVTASTAAEAALRVAADNLEIATRVSEDALKAPLASPAFTGTPTAPTAPAGASTSQLATTAFVTATAFSAVVPGQTGNAGKFLSTDGSNANWAAAKVATYIYDDRATLRTLSPIAGDLAGVDNLGLFVWRAASTTDDGETAFATASGAWEMVAASPEYVYSAWVADAGDLDARAQTLETANAKFLRGSFAMTLTSLATNAASDILVTMAGASLGDCVVVTPGNALGNTSADQSRVSYTAYVSAANTVTVTLRNASATLASFAASTWSVLVIKQ